jgi:hypothetical protein
MSLATSLLRATFKTLTMIKPQHPSQYDDTHLSIQLLELRSDRSVCARCQSVGGRHVPEHTQNTWSWRGSRPRRSWRRGFSSRDWRDEDHDAAAVCPCGEARSTQAAQHSELADSDSLHSQPFRLHRPHPASARFDARLVQEPGHEESHILGADGAMESVVVLHALRLLRVHHTWPGSSVAAVGASVRSSCSSAASIANEFTACD